MATELGGRSPSEADAVLPSTRLALLAGHFPNDVRSLSELLHIDAAFEPRSCGGAVSIEP